MTNQTSHYPGPAGGPPSRPGLWSRLTPMQRVGVILAVLVLPCCGGTAVIGALAGDAPPTAAAPVPVPDRQRLADGEPGAEPSTALGSAAPASAAPAAGTVAPVVEKRTVTERAAIPFESRTVRDDDLPEGEKRVRTRGVAGVRTLTYEVTVTGGVETGRKLVRSVVTKKPVSRVVAIGTRTAPAGAGCHPGYRPCVPVASDVDCAGGGGNGPAYVAGPVRVLGDDPYALDRDGDDVACD